MIGKRHGPFVRKFSQIANIFKIIDIFRESYIIVSSLVPVIGPVRT